MTLMDNLTRFSVFNDTASPITAFDPALYYEIFVTDYEDILRKQVELDQAQCRWDALIFLHETASAVYGHVCESNSVTPAMRTFADSMGFTQHHSFAGLENLSDINQFKAGCEGLLSNIWENIKRFFKWIWEKIKGFFKAIKNFIVKVLKYFGLMKDSDSASTSSRSILADEDKMKQVFDVAARAIEQTNASNSSPNQVGTEDINQPGEANALIKTIKSLSEKMYQTLSGNTEEYPNADEILRYTKDFTNDLFDEFDKFNQQTISSIANKYSNIASNDIQSLFDAYVQDVWTQVYNDQINSTRFTQAEPSLQKDLLKVWNSDGKLVEVTKILTPLYVILKFPSGGNIKRMSEDEISKEMMSADIFVRLTDIVRGKEEVDGEVIRDLSKAIFWYRTNLTNCAENQIENLQMAIDVIDRNFAKIYKRIDSYIAEFHTHYTQGGDAKNSTAQSPSRSIARQKMEYAGSILLVASDIFKSNGYHTTVTLVRALKQLDIAMVDIVKALGFQGIKPNDYSEFLKGRRSPVAIRESIIKGVKTAGNFNGIAIYVISSATFRTNGVDVDLAHPDACAGIFSYYPYQKAEIAINEVVDTAPSDIKNTILEHEVGHYMHNQSIKDELRTLTSRANRDPKTDYNRVVWLSDSKRRKSEYEADDYAAKATSPENVIKSLEWILQLDINSGDPRRIARSTKKHSSHPSIPKRIARIKENYSIS